MADTLTSNYGWVKPAVGDQAGIDAWGGKINNNLDGIDAQTFTASSTAARLVSSSADAGGFVNKLRNGTFDVWQRGSPITVPLNGTAMTADGWYVITVGGGSVSVLPGQITGGSSPFAGLLYMIIKGSTAGTVVAPTQRIESYISAQLGSRITVQVWAYCTVAQTPSLIVAYPTAQDSFGAQTNLINVPLQSCPAATWTRLAYTFSATPSQLVNGLQVQFYFPSGAGASGVIDLAAADIRSTPGLPVGLCANPPPPELRPIATEMAFCQRYYTPIVAVQLCGYASGAGNITTQSIILPVPMRGAPTIQVVVTGGNVIGTPTVGAANERVAQTYCDAGGAGNFYATVNLGFIAEL